MRELLDELAEGRQFYVTRNDTYASDLLLPFRLSPTPFTIDHHLVTQIQDIGEAVTAFMGSTSDLYKENETAKILLDRGKPDKFRTDIPMNYLFWRPDLILTKDGPVICEIETSPFGLGLSALLDQGYRKAGFELLAEEGALARHIADKTPSEGLLVYTDKTKAYAGQLEFLADTVFSGLGRSWESKHIAETGNSRLPVYRAHYLSEALTDPVVEAFYDNTGRPIADIPSPTPQFEEKALMAFLWDSRFGYHYQRELGATTLSFLRKVIPPTWILGEEDYFMPGLPQGITGPESLAGLTKNNRQFVLKSSGFAPDSSWSEGIAFLGRESRESAATLIGNALAHASSRLYVVQEFRKPADNLVTFLDEASGQIQHMMGRTRITPYFSTTTGKLLTAKATHCEAITHRIHAGLTSINTAVGID